MSRRRTSKRIAVKKSGAIYNSSQLPGFIRVDADYTEVADGWMATVVTEGTILSRTAKSVSAPTFQQLFTAVMDEVWSLSDKLDCNCATMHTLNGSQTDFVRLALAEGLVPQ